MKAQTPAEGILKTNDWGDSKVYRVVCECTDPDHDHNVWIEADESEVSVTIYSTVHTNFWSKTRWEHLWLLLTKGYIDSETTVVMRKQQAFNYAQTLLSAIEDVEQFRKKADDNRKTTN